MTTHKQWIERLKEVAATSHDPDTQVACIAVNPGGGYISAANCLPCRVRHTPERLQRPAKYNFIQHAERLLIARAANRGFCLQGATVYMNWFPCAACAGTLIEAGMRTLYYDADAYAARKDDPRYGFAEATDMLIEAHMTLKAF